MDGISGRGAKRSGSGRTGTAEPEAQAVTGGQSDDTRALCIYFTVTGFLVIQIN